MNGPREYQRGSCRVFMLNWVVNEHVFCEEDLRNQKITFPEATTEPNQDCGKGNGAALLSLQSPALNERLKLGGRPSFKGN